VDHKGWLSWLGPDQASDPAPVPIKRKPGPLVPEVSHIPQHEVAVDLIEAIAGIKESRAEASPWLVAEEAGILSCPGINPRGKHALGADTIPQGCIAGLVAITFLLSGYVLGPSRRLRPDGPNSVQVGLDSRLEARAELDVPAGIVCPRPGLHVATIRPKAHPGLAHSNLLNARTFVQGDSLNRVGSTVGDIGG
jgi:hypothetical protein